MTGRLGFRAGAVGGGEELVSGYIPHSVPSPQRPLVTRDPAWGMHTHTQLCCHISDKPADRRHDRSLVAKYIVTCM
jgi:hypothetical protein